MPPNLPTCEKAGTTESWRGARRPPRPRRSRAWARWRTRASRSPTARKKEKKREKEREALPRRRPRVRRPPVPAGIAPRADAVEDPTNMPGPKEIPAGSPGDPAAAPGRVPPGDSRSLRRRDATTYEFALIYRRATFVITRFGLVGTRGQWR